MGNFFRARRNPHRVSMEELERYGGSDRSAAQWSYIKCAIWRGWTESQTWHALMRRDNAAGEKLRQRYTKSEYQGRRYFTRDWDKALREISEVRHGGEIAEVTRVIQGIKDQVDGITWVGRSGKTDKAVINAFLSEARRLNRTEFGYSVRQVAEAAQVTPNTASKSIKRLTARGFLIVLDNGDGRSSTVYGVRRVFVIDTVMGTLPRRARTVSITNTHDLFSRGGLSRSCSEVYELLSDEPVKVPDLVALGVNRTTAYNCLRRLMDVGLAEKGAHGYVRGSMTLDEVADLYGVSGARERRSRAHAEHRVKRDAYLDTVDRARETHRANTKWYRENYMPAIFVDTGTGEMHKCWAVCEWGCVPNWDTYMSDLALAA